MVMWISAPGVSTSNQTMAERCTATTAEGHGCRQRSTVNESGLCRLHDPARKTQAQADRKRGGIASGKKRSTIKTVEPDEAPPAPTTIAECASFSSWAVQAVAVGDIDSKTAATIATLLNSLVRSLKDSKVTDDVADLRRQVTELRKMTG